MGRPRDPALTPRVRKAALAEYAHKGAASFTLRGVATRAGVGKSSLYRRWKTKEELLLDSIESLVLPLAIDHDTGSLRGDLTASAAQLLRHLIDPVGMVTLRAAVDVNVGAITTDVFHDHIVEAFRAAATTIFQRGLDRGEVRDDVPLDPLVVSFFGSVLTHALILPPSLRAAADADPIAHVAPYVDILVRSAAPTNASMNAVRDGR